ncbi:MAG TPA: carboxypeptidase regulatory-like domain-containing protein, partial [Candidatus Polarisedimenticolaceae bacterium]|nr:carboxypeptidase regulatory-like domain-containing protein [Candidatus Polarisedimenticolaceae bacterium]
MKRLDRNQGGFTMIELIVGATVMAIIVVSVLGLLVTSLAAVSLGKARSLGLSLANEKMEYLRDLPYDSLATQFGAIYPAGSIVDNQNITRNNQKFRVNIVIEFVDDPYDGNAAGTIAGKPTDLYSYDYKRAQINVYLVNSNSLVASLSTNIAAKAAETPSNTGILRINVQDASGAPVGNTSVHITNPTVSPAVDITTTTDSTGQVIIPKLPPDSGGDYHVVASLSGYNSDQTYVDPAGSQTPVKPNPNILVQQISTVTLSIDRLSTMNVHVVDTSGTAVSGKSVTVVSSRKIYTNPDVFEYNTAYTTNASGDIVIANLPWDGYNFSVPAGTYIVSVSPSQPTTVNPNSTTPVAITVSNSSSWPTIASVSPNSDAAGTNPSDITVTGTNLGSGTTVKLVKSGQPDIVATNLVYTGSTSL